MNEGGRLDRIENKIDKLIENVSGQNERIAKLEAHQKIVGGFTLTAFTAAITAVMKAFFGGFQ